MYPSSDKKPATDLQAGTPIHSHVHTHTFRPLHEIRVPLEYTANHYFHTRLYTIERNCSWYFPNTTPISLSPPEQQRTLPMQIETQFFFSCLILFFFPLDLIKSSLSNDKIYNTYKINALCASLYLNQNIFFRIMKKNSNCDKTQLQTRILETCTSIISDIDWLIEKLIDNSVFLMPTPAWQQYALVVLKSHLR